MPANNRLTYTGSATKVFVVDVSFGIDSDTNNTLTHVALGKNGDADNTTEIDNLIGTGNAHEAWSCHGLFSLATNDFIEGFVKADKASSITIVYYWLCGHIKYVVSCIETRCHINKLNIWLSF